MAIESRLTGNLRTLIAVIVVTAIAALGVKLYRLHADAHLRYNPRQEIVWLAPTMLDSTRNSTPISNKRWRQKYSDIERVLWEARDLDESSSETLALLERINKLLTENLAYDELARLRHLVEKSISSDNAQTVARWIVSYYHYNSANQQLRSDINQAAGDQRVALIENYLNNLDATQQRHFGNHASGLFGQLNSQTRYFYQRRLVRLDNTLDETQKKAALAAIKQDYQASLALFSSD